MSGWFKDLADMLDHEPMSCLFLALIVAFGVAVFVVSLS
jgi:hypothetical protein